jgi:hypothetical protein
MIKKKPRLPISSFAPELMEVLKRGSRERIVMLFSSEKGGRPAATKLRSRIHQLRAAMRAEDHDDYQIVAKAYCQLFWGDKAVAQGAPPDWADDASASKGALLIISPRDSEFTNILRGAIGKPSIAEPPPKAIEEEDDEWEDLMDELKEIEESKPPAGEV